ncbi:unnamed protein product [Nippostrongylus brasiliensis]|uniref:Endo/exonuclease/phosphatase domain-containing protein n=1 Tax=Nippostrongylus brasiliensis TaxID=27835 RepID=A0A0N4YIW4_NIPBR|nr:unnamed protein product [Nippostrongylus brasiliensis]
MFVRIDMKEGSWTIVSVYAPQTGCSDKEKDQFCEALDEVIRSVSEDDFPTIVGDLNGHVGTDRRGMERVHGGRGVGSKKETRESQKMAYNSGGRKTEVVYILMRRRALKNSARKKVLPTEDVAAQHRPLVADLNVILLPKVETVNEIRRLATQTILQCAKDVLGETKRGQKEDRAAWFWNDEVQKAVREKENAVRTWQTSRSLEDLAKYKEYKRRARIAVPRAKTTDV